MKVTYVDHMGNDLSVVNAAKVSFGKKSDWERIEDSYNLRREGITYYTRRVYKGKAGVLSKRDQGLIAFLARGCTSGDWEKLLGEDSSFWEHPDREQLERIVAEVRHMPTHWTPFGHTSMCLHLKVPFFVAAQVKKHQVGFVVNEISRRYVTDPPEFYIPEGFRRAAEDKKQGSLDEIVMSRLAPDEAWGIGMLEAACDKCLEVYNDMLQMGVAAEQARMVLPLNTYTEFYMTGSLYGWANLYNKRIREDTMKETREVAAQIGEIASLLYPVSWRELTK